MLEVREILAALRAPTESVLETQAWAVMLKHKIEGFELVVCGCALSDGYCGGTITLRYEGEDFYAYLDEETNEWRFN